jgi:Ca2+/Na+ antiporter
LYNSEEIFFHSGVSKNTIGEEVKVQFISGIIDSVRMQSRKILRTLAYMTILACMLILFIMVKELSPTYMCIYTLIPLCINYSALRLINKKFKEYGGIKKFMSKNSKIKTKEELNKLDIFWNNIEISAEDSRVYKPLLYITPILIILFMWPTVHFGKAFFKHTYVIVNFNSKLFKISELDIFISTIMQTRSLQKDFLIFTMSALFVLLLNYSLIFNINKTKKKNQ